MRMTCPSFPLCSEFLGLTPPPSITEGERIEQNR